MCLFLHESENTTADTFGLNFVLCAPYSIESLMLKLMSTPIMIVLDPTRYPLLPEPLGTAQTWDDV